MIVSKAEFARICNVTKGRVSQWIASGLIGPDALVGEGRNAKIDVEKAQRQVRARRDVAQMVNGIKTRLTAPPPPLVEDPGMISAEDLGIVAPNVPPVFRDRSPDFNEGALLAATGLVYKMGATAALLAVHSGMPLAVAYCLKDFLTVAMMIEVGETFVGGEHFLWDTERVDQVDWEELAAKKGEKVDIPSWEDLKRQLQQDFEALEA